MTDNDPGYIDPMAKLFWAAHSFRIAATHADRYELECLDGYENPRTLPKEKVRNLKLSGDLTVEPFYFDWDGKPAKSAAHIHMLSSKPPAEIRRTMLAYTKAKLLERAHKAGKVALYETQGRPRSNRRRRHTGKVTVDVWLKQNAAVIQAACYPFYLLDPSAPKPNERPRVGQLGLPALGSASKIKKDRAMLAGKDFKITDLCSDREAMRRGGRSLAPDMTAFVLVQLKEVLLRPERMTLAAFRRHVAAELKDTKSMRLRTPPSITSIETLIGTLDDAQVIAARFSPKKAVENRTIYTEGPEYTYPGEMVLMDCWKIDLVARLNEQGGWIFISDPELKLSGLRRRLWVCWVMDACSRAILGFSIGLSESSELTTRALRMAITDKTLQCEDAECEADPIPPIGIDGLLTDIGGAFKHPYFMVPALSLVPDADLGPGDNAHLRGLLERYNRTVKDQLLAYITGTTFGDVITKGDYDSMRRASMNVKTLGRLLWRWVNDGYNLSPHRGNDGQPPINRFEDRYLKHGTADVYTPERIRIAFAREFNLPVTRQGACFASNYYVSGRLQAFFRDNGKQKNGKPIKLRAKIDLTDLGRISVWIEGEWHTLVGPRRVQKVGFTIWQETREFTKKLYGDQAAVNADIVSRALLKIERMGTQARLEAQIKDMSFSSEEVVKAVSSIKLRIKEDETPMEPGRLLAFDASSTEAQFTTSGTNPYLDTEIEVAEDPYADAGDDQRAETDLGLDDADIDQDGDLLDDDAEDQDISGVVGDDATEPEVDVGTDDDSQALSQDRSDPKSIAEILAFLPQPTRRGE